MLPKCYPLTRQTDNPVPRALMSETSWEAVLQSRTTVWNCLVVGRVTGPQSRAWKVLTTVRVAGRGGRG